MRRTPVPHHWSTRLGPYLFVAPAMLLLITFGVFPILVAAVVSLTDMNISAVSPTAATSTSSASTTT